MNLNNFYLFLPLFIYRVSQKNETGVSLNISGCKEINYCKLNVEYKNFSERFKKAKILKPNFTIQKFKMLMWKTTLMKYRNI